MVGATIAQVATHAPAPGPGLAPDRVPGDIPGLEAVAGGTQVGAPEMDTATPAHQPGVVGMDPGAEAGTCSLVCMGGERPTSVLGPKVSETRKRWVCREGRPTL